MAAVDNSVLNSLNSLNALAGKISPQSNSTDKSNKSNNIDCSDSNGTSADLGATQNGSVMNHREPDPDAIKMFVGQVPRSMDENDLRKMFEEFGEVYQVNVLRDKISGQSKGCCFVTFYTRKAALEAQNALHNIKTLAGMHHPIQMKPADTENRNERKLFIGMLNKRYNEQEVRNLFTPYGTIEECTVLRDSNGQSKGCAFVTFTSRQSAINAIKKMHHSQTMEYGCYLDTETQEISYARSSLSKPKLTRCQFATDFQGCSSPVVVKFADTQKEKDAKRLHHNLWNMSPTPSTLTTLGPQYLALLQQQVGNSSSGAATGGIGALAASIPQLSSLNNLSVQQLLAASQGNLAAQQIFDSPGLSSLGSLSALSGGLSLSATTNGTQESNLQGLLASLTGQNQGLSVNMQNLATLAAMTSGNSTGLQALAQPILTSLTSSPGGFGSSLAQSLSSVTTGPATGKQIEGPEGANLFIYHLPQEFTDQDLAQTFWPFGKVVSAKVFIDKQTNLSKCFGFVSYENAMDAQRAIQHMNGQQIGNKRLKVQLKRSKNDNKPY